MSVIRKRRKGHDFKSILNIMWITDTHLIDGDAKSMPEFVAKVNAEKPDLIIHTGDIVEDQPIFDQFMVHWNQIDPTIPKYITVGNHDYDKVDMQEIADGLGYGTRPIIAGSRFNQTFSINGVRVVMMDTIDGKPTYHGYANSELQSWLSNILLTCTESHVLLFMHNGPQLYWTPTPAFVEADARALKAIVENALDTNKHIRKISTCFGHRHGNNSVWTYNQLGSKFLGYLNVAATDNFTWLFTKMEVSDRKIKFKKGN